MHTRNTAIALCSAIASSLVLAASTASASEHAHLLPERNDRPDIRANEWQQSGDWLVAPADRPPGHGSRVAALAEVPDGDAALAIEARGVSESHAGPWLALEETYRGDGSRVAVVDLDERWPAAELRIAAWDEPRVGDLAWELLEPRYPEAGARAREAAQREQDLGLAGAAEEPLDSDLGELGVVSRSEWGARPTGCTAQEDSWYRMAIHHTAANQTLSGSVSAEVRSVQAYHQDSGIWCDIAYQYLVGYDGQIFEGRPIHLRSGATGGANDGNIAISFLGCYHPSGCTGSSHDPTAAMMERALALVQTLGSIHDIPLRDDTILGHRDYGGGTACPGEYVHDRLHELRREREDEEDEAPAYAAEIESASIAEAAGQLAEGADPGASIGELAIAEGESARVAVEVKNVGSRAWEPGVTYLAPTAPRDEPSPHSNATWPAPDRAATVREVVQPGEAGRLSFEIYGAEEGEHELTFGMVHEGVTWFSDDPLGGGPGDDALRVQVAVEGDGSFDDSGVPADGAEGERAVSGGCRAAGGAPAPAPFAFALALALGWLARRARRDA